MAIDFKALGAKAAASGADMTKATTGGGGDYTPPAAGPGLCRFVAYIETGKHTKTFQGKESIVDEVQLVFELVGKRHAPRELNDGTKVPHRITIREKLSRNEKANFMKLFQRMNYKQEAQHMAQLLGEGFKCEVIHDTWTGKDGKARTDAVLRNAAGYTLAPPRKEDEDSDTGWVDVAVPSQVSQNKCFLWDHADLEQWASIYIEGEYPERKDDKGVVVAKAKSKNVLQDRIKAAKNFQGSPIHELLVSGGHAIDLPEVDEGNGPPWDEESGVTTTAGSSAPAKTLTTSHSNDALGGIV